MCVKKIYTIRNPEEQREHLWSARRIEEEVDVCSRRAITRYFLDHLPKDAPILEAGCGLGAWVVYLTDRGYDIAGIDNDGKVIDRIREWRPSLKVLHGDIRKLPYEDGSLGAVLSLGVMEHFEEGCGDALKETYRVLRPGGLLFFTVPMNNPLSRVAEEPGQRNPFRRVPVFQKGSGDVIARARLRTDDHCVGRFFGEEHVFGALVGFSPTSVERFLRVDTRRKGSSIHNEFDFTMGRNIRDPLFSEKIFSGAICLD
jgi:SAM-dependent methyltransferase